MCCCGQHPQAYGAFHEDTVGQIPSFHKPVISVPSNAPALRAFELMMKHDISAVWLLAYERLHIVWVSSGLSHPFR
jgi:hypothetical protein